MNSKKYIDSIISYSINFDQKVNQQQINNYNK